MAAVCGCTGGTTPLWDQARFDRHEEKLQKGFVALVLGRSVFDNFTLVEVQCLPGSVRQLAVQPDPTLQAGDFRWFRRAKCCPEIYGGQHVFCEMRKARLPRDDDDNDEQVDWPNLNVKWRGKKILVSSFVGNSCV